MEWGVDGYKICGGMTASLWGSASFAVSDALFALIALMALWNFWSTNEKSCVTVSPSSVYVILFLTLSLMKFHNKV